MQPARAEPIRFTYEDYLGFPDDGRRHELIDGEHLVTPAPTRRHQELSGRLSLALGSLRTHPVGQVYAAPLDVILSDTDVVQPDILFVSNERREVLDPKIEVVKVYRRTDSGGFPRIAELTREEGGVLDTPLLPGFALELAELFARSSNSRKSP